MAEYKPNYRPTTEQLQLHNVELSPNHKTVVFFGGKKGVGKSSGGLGDAFAFALKYPKSKICIVGETLDNVRDSFLVKLPNLFPDHYFDEDGKRVSIYRYYDKPHSTFLSRSIVFTNGSFITLQYCSNLAEALQFQGKEYNLIIIDEITRHIELEITLIESSLRASVVFDNGVPRWIPTKLVCLGNPGGKGNDWVLEKYIRPCVKKWLNRPNTLIPIETKDHIYMQKVKGRKPIKVIQRFIQGENNPFINAAYYASLMELPENFRKQYLDGDWGVVSGRMFKIREEAKISYDVADALMKEVPYRTFISIDWGYNPSFHSAHWHAVFPSTVTITFQELYGQSLNFENFVKEIVLMSDAMDMDIEYILLPHDMYRRGDTYRDETGKIIGEMKSDVFENAGFTTLGVASGTSGIVSVRNAKVDSSTGTSTPDGKPKFYIVQENCPNLIEEMEGAFFDDLKPGHVAKGLANHAIDDYGLFLTFYSDDIAPLESIKDVEEKKSLSRFAEKMRKADKEYEEELQSEQFYDNDF